MAETLQEMIQRVRDGAKRVGDFNKRFIVKRITDGKRQYVKTLDPMTFSVTTHMQMKRNHTAFLTRNSRCPCGSGRRFKRCCQIAK